MAYFKKIIHILKNKYVLTGLIFIIWISFFDSYSLIKRYSYVKKLNQIKANRKYYLDEIHSDSATLRLLESGDDNLEKFARERYLMKKDSEDIFIVVKQQALKKL